MWNSKHRHPLVLYQDNNQDAHKRMTYISRQMQIYLGATTTLIKKTCCLFIQLLQLYQANWGKHPEYDGRNIYGSPSGAPFTGMD